MRKSFVKDSLSNYVVFAIQMAIGVVAIPVYLATYGETLYGVYLLSIGLASSLLFLEFGSGRAMLRYTAEYLTDGERDKYAHALQTCLLITAVTSVVVTAVFVALAHVQDYAFNIDPGFRREAYYLFLGTGAYAFLLVAAQLPQAMLKGAGIFFLRNQLVVVELALRAAVLALVWYYGLNIYWLLASEIALITMALAFDFVTLRRHAGAVLDAGLLRVRTGRPYFRGEVFTYAKETFLLSLVGFFVQHTDKIVIGVFLDVRFVAVYAVIYKPYTVIKSVANKTFVVLQPYYVRIRQRDGTERLRAFVNRMSLLINTAFALGLAAAALALPTVVYYWLGTREYDAYIVYGQLLVLAYAIKTTTAIPNGLLYIVGETRRLFRLELAATALNFALSIALVQYVGVGGVLLGTFVALLFSTPYLLRVCGQWLAEEPGAVVREGALRPLTRRFYVNTAGMAAVTAASVAVRAYWADTPAVADLVAVAAAAVLLVVGVAALARPGLREFRALSKEFL